MYTYLRALRRKLLSIRMCVCVCVFVCVCICVCVCVFIFLFKKQTENHSESGCLQVAALPKAVGVHNSPNKNYGVHMNTCVHMTSDKNT